MLQPKHILFVGTNSKGICQDLIEIGYIGQSFHTIAQTEAWIKHQLFIKKKLPDIIFSDLELPDGDSLSLFDRLKRLDLMTSIQFVILSLHDDECIRKRAHQAGIDDFFHLPANPNDIHYRLQYISIIKAVAKNLHLKTKPPVGIPLVKRAFDIIVSIVALILLQPIWLLVAIMIKLDSRGSILYVSRRAGYNYQIFDFYKFRTMRMNADRDLQQLADINLYENSPFIKIKNDPRITRLGTFLRNTSLDELPQLINVLKGDMSLIGNRPLPLYEAEHLTTDELSLRFLAPAGITGLWQVTKRGQNSVTDLERKNLDLQYAAAAYSAKMDYKIFIKTFGALWQKTDV